MCLALLAGLGRFPDAQSGSQPTPQRRRHQQLRPPPPQTAPFLPIAASTSRADRACCLPQNHVPIERFHDDRRRIPPPRMQPIGQSAHGVAAPPTQVPPHPNHHPPRTSAANKTAIILLKFSNRALWRTLSGDTRSGTAFVPEAG